jgi:hypothetical protein
MSSLDDIAQRLRHQEELHGTGGACAEGRNALWAAVAKLTNRVTVLETKFYVGAVIIATVVPVVSAWIQKKMGL